MKLRVIGLLLSATSIGCGVILGLEDKRPYPSGSDAGALDANTSAVGDGSSTDVATSGCPRDCRGGTCDGGTCGVVTLARMAGDAGDAEVEHPEAVAVTDTLLFWSTSRGNVYRCDLAQCDASTKAIALTSKQSGIGYSDETDVFSLYADATHVYWAQYYGQKLFRALHDGSQLEQRSANGYPNSFVVDATNVYWLNFGAGSSAVWRVAKSALGQASPAIFMSDPYVSQTPPSVDCTEAENRCWYGNSLAENGNKLVFTDGKPKPLGEILSIAKDAIDAAVTPAGHGGFPGPSSVTAFDDVVYWTQYGFLDDAGAPVEGEVVKMRSSYVPQAFVNKQSKPQSIATDGIDLFWFAEGAGAIRRCAIGGCEFKPDTLVANQRGATSLVAKGGALYWANSTGTEVQMIVVR